MLGDALQTFKIFSSEAQTRLDDIILRSLMNLRQRKVERNVKAQIFPTDVRYFTTETSQISGRPTQVR